MFLVLMSVVAAIFHPVLAQQTLPITVQQGVLDKCPSDEAKENVVQDITASFHSMLEDFSFDLTAVPTTARATIPATTPATTPVTTPGSTPATTPGSTSATTPATIPSEEEAIEYVLAPQCGVGVWRKVVSFNMSDLKCPSPWIEYTTIKACGRSHAPGCESVVFSVDNFPYDKVCGRAVGYQHGSCDGFGYRRGTVDDNYVDGLSVTNGSPRNHIWSFAVGLSENHAGTRSLCPCVDSNFTVGSTPPPYVEENYFCETGNPDTNLHCHTCFYPEPLWDGEGCATSQCCSFNTPPWFNVSFTTSTTADIEVRICTNEPKTNEDVSVGELDIYVQ